MKNKVIIFENKVALVLGGRGKIGIEIRALSEAEQYPQERINRK